MSDLVWHGLAIGGGVLVFAVICYVSIMARKATAREEARLTPEELARKRREERVFQGAFRRRP